MSIASRASRLHWILASVGLLVLVLASASPATRSVGDRIQNGTCEVLNEVSTALRLADSTVVLVDGASLIRLTEGLLVSGPLVHLIPTPKLAQPNARLIGVIKAASGQVSPLYIPSAIAGYVRVVEDGRGGFFALITEAFPATLTDPTTPSDSIVVSAAHYSGGRWRVSERIASLGNVVADPEFTSKLVRFNNSLLVAFPMTSTTSQRDSVPPGLLMVSVEASVSDGFRLKSDTLHTTFTPSYVSTAVSVSSDSVLVIFAADHLDQGTATGSIVHSTWYRNDWSQKVRAHTGTGVSMRPQGFIHRKDAQTMWKAWDEVTNSVSLEWASLGVDSILPHRVAILGDFDGFSPFELGGQTLVVTKTLERPDSPSLWMIRDGQISSLGSLAVSLHNYYPTALALSDSTFVVSSMSVLPPGSASPAVTLLTTVTLKCTGAT